MTGNDSRERIRLAGGPEQAVSSVEVTASGAVHFDFFDFSPVAQEHFGNDVAITIVVPASGRSALLEALGLSPDAEAGAILQACANRFHHYFEVQPFLEAHAVPFEKTFDSHA